MKMKKILKEWRSFLSINESEAFSFDPETMLNSDISRMSPKTANPQINDKTNFSLKAMIKDIYKIIEREGKVYVTYVDSWDDEVPRLTVNPHIQYQTPHGIYSYPLTFDTFSNMLSTGSPANVEFATSRLYFHVFQIDDANKIKINADQTTSYNNRKYPGDLKTVVRMYCQFTLSHIAKNVGVYDEYDDEIRNIRNDTKNKGREFLSSVRSATSSNNIDDFNKACYDYLFKDYTSFSATELESSIKVYIGLLNYEEVVTSSDISGDNDEYYDFLENPEEYGGSENYTAKDTRRIPDKCVDFLAKILHTFSNTSDNKFVRRTKENRFYNIYYIIRLLSQFTELDYENKNINVNDKIVQGGMFSLFLRGINIDSIDDSDGTSMLHDAEPSQAVAMEMSRSTTNLFGTYKNPYGRPNEQSMGEEEKARILNSIIDCVNELAEEGEIDLLKLNVRQGSHKVNKTLTDFEVNILSKYKGEIKSVIDAISYYIADYDGRLKEYYDRIYDDTKTIIEIIENSEGKELNNVNTLLTNIKSDFGEIFKQAIEIVEEEESQNYESSFIPAVMKTEKFKEEIEKIKNNTIEHIVNTIDEDIDFISDNLSHKQRQGILNSIESTLRN